MAEQKTQVVSIESGQLQGVYQEAERIAVFKGIPFAAPPVGELRWKPPQPVAFWEGVRQATKFSSMAYQRAAEFEKFVGHLIGGQGWNPLRREGLKLLLKVAPKPKMSEDCLYLNVRTPLLDSAAKLPVMVWIHGGDHQDGSGSEVFYDSNELAKRGVVVVSINYRLGVMGYFAHPELSAESSQGVSGNYGTLDQIAALEWVQNNIEAFGGDPDNVTIFGESAGGESVAHMLISPLAQGLFHKAILQSPANAGQMYHLRESFLTRMPAEEVGLGFAEKVGVVGDNQLARLRELSADALYKVSREEKVLGAFYPVIDRYVLPDSPFTVFAEQRQARVPIMVGSNADEGSLIHPMLPTPLAEYIVHELEAPEANMPRFMNEAFGEEVGELLTHYPGLAQRDPQAESEFLGDSFFGSKTRYYAECQAKAALPAYFYMFTRTPPSAKQTIGAFHAAELSFVHGTNTPILPLTKQDLGLSRQMISYWTQFAKTADPNQGNSPPWDRFDPDNPEWMVLGTDFVGMTAVNREEKYRILNAYTDRLVQKMQAMREFS